MIFCMAMSMAACAQQKKAKMLILTGKVTEVTKYCGGAPMNNEMRQEMEAPKPAGQKMLYLKKGRVNTGQKALYNMRADDYGNFTLVLKPGVYCLVEEYKTKPFKSSKNDEIYTWDVECLKKEWSKCDKVIVLPSKDSNNVEVNYTHHCEYRQPCLKEFKGAYPQ